MTAQEFQSAQPPLKYSSSNVEELSYWLLGKDVVEDTCRKLSLVAAKSGIEVELREVNEFEGEMWGISPEEKERMIVWLITDGHQPFRNYSMSMRLQAHGLRCFGCHPLMHMEGQDKSAFYDTCHNLHIPFPKSNYAVNGVYCGEYFDIEPPYFVKWSGGGNKISIDEHSRCETLQEAFERACALNDRLGGKAIIQEFINGPECRLTFINAGEGEEPKFGFQLVRPEIRDNMYIVADDRIKAYDHFLDVAQWVGIDTELRDDLIGQMKRAAVFLGYSLGLTGYFTLDFRIDLNERRAYVIDFNPFAFLYGDDVEANTRQTFGLGVDEAIFQAIVKSFMGQQANFGACCAKIVQESQDLRYGYP